jgi:hypothetical protein
MIYIRLLRLEKLPERCLKVAVTAGENLVDFQPAIWGGSKLISFIHYEADAFV